MEQPKLLTGPSDMDQSTVTVTCPDHGEYESHLIEFCGKSMQSPCPECERIKDEEKKNLSKAIDQKLRFTEINALVDQAQIPKRYQSVTLAGYQPTTDESSQAKKICERYAERWKDRKEKGGGLVLTGMPGTGKTHLAIGILMHVMMTHLAKCMYTKSATLFRHIKSSYGSDSSYTEQDAINHFLSPDLLVIDEVGVQFGTQAEQLLMFEIINGRYEEIKPTILISNLNLEQLKQEIGERIVDRMREGGGSVISFDWESYRK
jgi:DNA replication protein DnaC